MDQQADAGQIGLPPGTRIGKYEIRQRIAAGGQSIVYKGYDALQDRYVAIKQISSALAESPRFVEGFRREAQILKDLWEKHAAVACIYELLEDPRGLFIVTEFVEGKTIEQILNDSPGPCDPKMVLQILWRLAAALQKVHQAGIVHRDIKPSNIIVTDKLEPKITDFGIAGGGSGQTSMLMGTTKYMAPEIFAGQAPDGRADIYSLGMIAYEMLIGRQKFNEIFAEVVRDRHTEPLRWMKWHSDPSAQAPPLHEVNPDVPLAVSDLVAKMLAKDRQERYQNAAELADAVKAAYSARSGLVGLDPKRPSEAIAEAGAAVTQTGPQSVVAEELPTAPLPRKPISLRAKLLIAGAVAAAMILTVGTAAYVHYSSSLRVARRARAILAEAERYYSAGKYTQALDTCRQLDDPAYGGVRQARQGKILAELCKAHVAVEQALAAKGDSRAKQLWRQAQAAEEKARNLNEAFKRDYSSSDARLWSKQTEQRIETFSNQRVDAWYFSSSMAEARKLFADGRFDKAIEKLDELSVSGTRLDEQQRREVRDLSRRIRTAALKTRFEELLRAGDELARNLKPDDAQARYGQARAMLDAPEAAQLLSPKQRQAYADDCRQREATLEKIRLHVAALAEADKAKQAGDKAAELAKLKQAQQAYATDALAKRIADLQAELALQQARKLKQLWTSEKDPQQAQSAIEAYQQALAAKQDEAVSRELAEFETDVQRWALIQAADAATADGQFDKALELYNEAGRIRQDEELSSRLVDCRYLKQVAAADALRDAGQYDQAQEAYERARLIKPQATGELDAKIAMLDLMRDYDAKLAEAQAYLDQQQFSRAISLYRGARDMVEQANRAGQLEPRLYDRLIGHVKQLWNDAQYAKFIHDGTEAMDRGDYAVARANFNQAKQYKDTEQVRRLLEQLRRLEQRGG